MLRWNGPIFLSPRYQIVLCLIIDNVILFVSGESAVFLKGEWHEVALQGCGLQPALFIGMNPKIGKGIACGLTTELLWEGIFCLLTPPAYEVCLFTGWGGGYPVSCSRSLSSLWSQVHLRGRRGTPASGHRSFPGEGVSFWSQVLS